MNKMDFRNPQNLIIRNLMNKRIPASQMQSIRLRCTMLKNDDPSAKPQVGLNTMTTIDEHSTEWKNRLDVKSSEFENAFLLR